MERILFKFCPVYLGGQGDKEYNKSFKEIRIMELLWFFVAIIYMVQLVICWLFVFSHTAINKNGFKIEYFLHFIPFYWVYWLKKK